MGRKKKKVIKPWCWYCNRDFEDEKILIQHQKAKHFKCHVCHKKLYTGPGLAVHCLTVHKETIDKIPNSIPTRGSTELEVYGMEGIPPADMKKHEAEVLGKSIDDEPDEKRTRIDFPVGMVHPGLMPMMGPLGARAPIMPGIPPMPFPPVMPGFPPVPPVVAPPVPPIPRIPSIPAMPGMSAPKTTASAISSPPNVPRPPPLPATAPPPAPPTFPAYGNHAPPNMNSTATHASGFGMGDPYISAAAKLPIGTVQAATGTKIIHPDEDISLEERRSNFPKYALASGKMSRSLGPGSLKANLNPVSLSNVDPLPSSGYTSTRPALFGFQPMSLSGSSSNYGYGPSQQPYRPAFGSRPGFQQAPRYS